MKRLILSLSKITLASILLTNTAHAYIIPTEQVVKKSKRVIMMEKAHYENLRLEDKVQTVSKPKHISPATLQERNTTTPQESYEANAPVTRAELIVMIVEDRFGGEIPLSCYDELSPSNYWLLFSDVEKDASYGLHLCAAMMNGIVSGYSDSTFRPNNPVNYAEASKIIAKAYRLSVDSSDPGLVWYAPYVETMRSKDALPEGSLSQELNHGTLQEILLKLGR